MPGKAEIGAGSIYHALKRLTADGRIEVPTGVAAFPQEIGNAPRAWAERHYAIRHWTVFPSGGHFAAMERPAELAADLREFFRALR